MTNIKALREIQKAGTSEMARAASSFINRPNHGVNDISAIKRLIEDYENYCHHLYSHYSNQDYCSHCANRS